MRPPHNNNNRRQRGGRPHNNNGNNNGGNNNRRGGGNQQVNLRNQIFDSHGPGGERVRGNAFQVHEKYLSLARDAEERIDQENYYQHAEHYYRIVEAIQEMEAEQRARFTVVESDPFTENGDEQPSMDASHPGMGDQPSSEGSSPSFSLNDEQPQESASEEASAEEAPRQRRPRRTPATTTAAE